MKSTVRLAGSVVLATAFVASPGIANAGASAATPVVAPSPAAPPYPGDDSPFVIPVKPIEKSTFGTKLASLCAVLSTMDAKALGPAASFDMPTLDADIQSVAKASTAVSEAREKLDAAKSLLEEKKKLVAGMQAALVGLAANANEAARAAAQKSLDAAKVEQTGAESAIAPAQVGYDAAVAAAAKQGEAVVPQLVPIAQTCGILRDSSKWDTLAEADLALLRALHKSKNLSALANALDAQRGSVSRAASPKALAAAFASAVKANELGNEFANVAGLTPAGSFASLGDKFINGLADFMVTRAKQEAIFFLQDQMRDTLCNGADGKKGPGALMLSNTCDTLLTLDTGMSLHSMGTHMNVAAKKDLVLLPDTSLTVATSMDPKHHYIYEPARLSYAIVRKMEQGRHAPLDVLASVQGIAPRACEKDPGATDEGKWCRVVFRSVRLGSSFIYTVRSTDGLDAMISGADAEAGPRLVAFGLDLEARASRSFAADKLRVAMKSFRDGADLVLKLKKSIEEANEASKKLEGTPEERRKHIAEATLDASLTMIRLAKTLTAELEAPNEKLSKVLSVLESSAKLGQASLEPDYGAISVNMTTLVSAITALLPENGEDPSDEAGYQLAQLLKKVANYTPFITEIASAKSSKDVAAAFEAAAAPVGSYKVKFDRPTIALNAFVGVSVANEWLLADRATGSGVTFGGFAPVGIHLSKSFFDSGAVPFGIMVSLLDLGTLTQQRFATEVQDETTKDPMTGQATTPTEGTASPSAQVGWEQFFSPGLYVTMGLGNRKDPSPFTLGGGISVVPNLRRIELTDAAKTSFDSPVFRLGAFLAVDLTLFPLN